MGKPLAGWTISEKAVLYTITHSQDQELNTPVFTRGHGDEDCLALFETQQSAASFLEVLSDAQEQTVAELDGPAVVQLIVRGYVAGIDGVIFNPGGAEEPRRFLVADLVQQLSVDLSRRLGVHPEGKERQPRSHRLACPKCGDQQTVALGDTIPMCCGVVMQPVHG